VAAALWLDSPEARAFGSLRSALWRVQHSAGDVVCATGPLLALAPWVHVDVRESTCLSRALIGSDDGPVPTVDWGLLTGELLPDWDEDWVLVERESHRHLSLHAMERLSDRLLTAGAVAQALEVALAVYVREPLRESAHRLMIRAHLAEGNAAEAIRQYRLYERLALTQLGLAPSPHMRDLLRDVLVAA
jgi:DNA-binding SARP family transcriptional activator